MKILKGLAIILAIMILVSIPAVTIAKTNSHTVENGNSRSFTLEYVVNVPEVAKGTKEINMWIPYPPTNEDQEISGVTIDAPSQVKVSYETKYGNGMLYLAIKEPDPKGFSFKASYLVKRLERTAKKIDLSYTSGIPTDPEAMSPYMESSRMEIINDSIRKMAKEATAGKNTEIEKANAIYQYILAKMNYNKEIPGWGQGDVNRVCLSIEGKGEGYGNCTDFHSLFASMMRSEGIPVKFEMGYPLTPGKSQADLKKGGYHCWAKFFIAGYGWIPVDISEARKDLSKKDYFWGSICENRITFSVGRDIILSPAQAGAPLNYFGPDPYIEADGKPFNNFERLVAYKDAK